METAILKKRLFRIVLLIANGGPLWRPPFLRQNLFWVGKRIKFLHDASDVVHWTQPRLPMRQVTNSNPREVKPMTGLMLCITRIEQQLASSVSWYYDWVRKKSGLSAGGGLALGKRHSVIMSAYWHMLIYIADLYSAYILCNITWHREFNSRARETNHRLTQLILVAS